jgi:prepilin-type N-terminal cleavage/methylation domain-containing protein
MRTERGFTIIELMIVVVIIGILAAIAIPMFSSHMKSAKANEASLQLNQLGKNAKTYYQANNTFPQGTATPLPGADGSACDGSGKPKHIVSSAWSSDTVWSALDFHIEEPNYFTYHYSGTSPTTAEALSVADLDCDRQLATYTLLMTVPEGQPAVQMIAPRVPD